MFGALSLGVRAGLRGFSGLGFSIQYSVAHATTGASYSGITCSGACPYAIPICPAVPYGALYPEPETLSDIIPIMENQMDKNMENEMETGIIMGYIVVITRHVPECWRSSLVVAVPKTREEISRLDPKRNPMFRA